MAGKLPDRVSISNTMHTVAIIDDNVPFTRMLKRTMEARYDVLVVEVNRSPEAVVRVAEFIPDVTLLDLVMPSLDGGDFLAGLREIAGIRGIPVVIFTALKQKGDSRVIDGFVSLAKPAKLDEIAGAFGELGVQVRERSMAAAA